jgi:hypothetical protein
MFNTTDCAEPVCEVVYFSNENVHYFVKDDVAVRIFAKDSNDDVKVCYCFNWTRGQIKEQAQKTGTSTAPFEIAQEVKSGNCAFDLKNPKGECCLGDVHSAAEPQPKTFTADDAEKARMYADLFHILSILFILSNSFDRMNGIE